MSEFILNTEGVGAPWFSLDAFTQGFIEAAFFNEVSYLDPSDFFSEAGQEDVREGRSDGNIPNDAGPAAIDRDSFCRIKDFCDEFQQRAAAVLAEAYTTGDYDEMQAGRDLYFTYAGHGVGYWSREELSQSSDPDESARLKEIMRAKGTTPDEWAALNDQVKTLESTIGKRLSEFAGQGEICLSAYEDSKHSFGYQVEFYIS